MTGWQDDEQMSELVAKPTSKQLVILVYASSRLALLVSFNVCCVLLALPAALEFHAPEV